MATKKKGTGNSGAPRKGRPPAVIIRERKLALFHCNELQLFGKAEQYDAAPGVEYLAKRLRPCDFPQFGIALRLLMEAAVEDITPVYERQPGERNRLRVAFLKAWFYDQQSVADFVATRGRDRSDFSVRYRTPLLIEVLARFEELTRAENPLACSEGLHRAIKRRFHKDGQQQGA